MEVNFGIQGLSRKARGSVQNFDDNKEIEQIRKRKRKKLRGKKK